jgi:hypothetical protein
MVLDPRDTGEIFDCDAQGYSLPLVKYDTPQLYGPFIYNNFDIDSCCPDLLLQFSLDLSLYRGIAHGRGACLRRKHDESMQQVAAADGEPRQLGPIHPVPRDLRRNLIIPNFAAEPNPRHAARRRISPDGARNETPPWRASPSPPSSPPAPWPESSLLPEINVAEQRRMARGLGECPLARS